MINLLNTLTNGRLGRYLRKRRAKKILETHIHAYRWNQLQCRLMAHSNALHNVRPEKKFK